jgi:hypothetical protein
MSGTQKKARKNTLNMVNISVICPKIDTLFAENNFLLENLLGQSPLNFLGGMSKFSAYAVVKPNNGFVIAWAQKKNFLRVSKLGP